MASREVRLIRAQCELNESHFAVVHYQAAIASVHPVKRVLILTWRTTTEFIARFGHGTVKMVRQAQSREKLLEKKLEAGLTELPELDQVGERWDARARTQPPASKSRSARTHTPSRPASVLGCQLDLALTPP